MEGSALVEQLRARLSQRERDLAEVLVRPRPSTLDPRPSVFNPQHSTSSTETLAPFFLDPID